MVLVWQLAPRHTCHGAASTPTALPLTTLSRRLLIIYWESKCYNDITKNFVLFSLFVSLLLLFILPCLVIQKFGNAINLELDNKLRNFTFKLILSSLRIQTICAKATKAFGRQWILQPPALVTTFILALLHIKRVCISGLLFFDWKN